jgi:hypothetical protein
MRASGEIGGLSRTPFEAKNENAFFGANLRVTLGDTPFTQPIVE